MKGMVLGTDGGGKYGDDGDVGGRASCCLCFGYEGTVNQNRQRLDSTKRHSVKACRRVAHALCVRGEAAWYAGSTPLMHRASGGNDEPIFSYSPC